MEEATEEAGGPPGARVTNRELWDRMDNMETMIGSLLQVLGVSPPVPPEEVGVQPEEPELPEYAEEITPAEGYGLPGMQVTAAEHDSKEEMPAQESKRDVKALADKVMGPELEVDDAMKMLDTDEEKEQLLAELRTRRGQNDKASRSESKMAMTNLVLKLQGMQSGAV